MSVFQPEPIPDWIKDLLAENQIPLDRVFAFTGYDVPTPADPRRVTLDVEVLIGHDPHGAGIQTKHVNLTGRRPKETMTS